MLNAYSNSLTIPANRIVPFSSVHVLKGSAVTLMNSTIQLNKKGAYLVTFDVQGLPSEAGLFTVEMTRNGVVQSDAIINIPSTLVSVGISGSLTTIVTVPDDNTKCCFTSPVELEFLNAGVGIANAHVSVTVTKIC